MKYIYLFPYMEMNMEHIYFHFVIEIVIMLFNFITVLNVIGALHINMRCAPITFNIYLHILNVIVFLLNVDTLQLKQ